MNEFTLTKAMLIGNPDLDSQHQALVDQIASIESLEGGPPERTEACAAFLKALRDHCAFEENLMQRHHYTRTEMHHEHHARINDHAEHAVAECANASDCAGCDMSNVLAIVFDELIPGDSDFKNFLDARGVTDGMRKMT